MVCISHSTHTQHTAKHKVRAPVKPTVRPSKCRKNLQTPYAPSQGLGSRLWTLSVKPQCNWIHLSALSCNNAGVLYKEQMCSLKTVTLPLSTWFNSHGHPTERGKTLVQRKPTMYPAWKSSFDAHIYEGRVLQVLLMKTAEEPLSEVTVGVSVLAERCKKASGRAEFWVSVCACMCLCVTCFC